MNQRRAFSLLELLITISIVTIVLAIAIPRIIPSEHTTLIYELEKMASTFTYLQQKALASNIPQTLTFDIPNNSYSFQGPSGKNTVYKLPESLFFGCIQNILGPPAKPIQPITDPITFKKDHKNTETPLFQATFFTNGQITPGAAYLIDQDKKVVGAFTCAVSQVSYIRVYLYENNAWKIHSQ